MRYSNSIQWITANGPGAGGLELPIEWADGEAVVHLTVPPPAQAAPGIAHGGFLATLADHVMGFVAVQQGSGAAAATRQLTVSYLAPTPVSRAITIRSRAEEISERTIIVSLQGSLDDTGRVTFTAKGDFARVSPARRHDRRAGADYETLEERFDPAQVFGWVTAALTGSYQPGILGQTVVVAVQVRDGAPQHWTLTATDSALHVEAGEPASCDVRFTGTVRAWRELAYGASSAAELAAAGAAAIEDPARLLPLFLRALTGSGDEAGQRD